LSRFVEGNKELQQYSSFIQGCW